MLRPRWRKVLRDLWLHKARTALVTVAIAVGIVGAGAVLTTWGIVRTAVDEEYRLSNPASATLRLDTVTGTVLRQAAAFPGIAVVQSRRSVAGRAFVQGGWRPMMLFAYEDLGTVTIGRLRTEAGRQPMPDGAIAVERSSLEFSGVGVDDSLLVRLGDTRPQLVAVGGIVRDVGLAPGWMEHVIYAFATRATIARMGVPPVFDQLQFVVRDRTLDQDGVRRIAFDAKRRLEAAGRTVRDVDVPVPGRHIHADQMDSLLYTQAGFGILALLLSCLLVVNLIEAMLAGQVREIGVLKTLGANAGDVARMYFALASALGLVAAVIAIPVASFVGRRYAQFTAEMLNFDATQAPVPVWVIAVELAVGALLPVLAAALPVVRGCRLPVATALRDYGVNDGGRSMPVTGSRLHGVARPLVLSVRNAFRRRQRMLLTLLTLSVGGAMFLGARSLRASIRGTMDETFAPMHFDLSMQLVSSLPADSLVAMIQRVPEVVRAEPWGGGGASVVRPDGTFGNRFVVAAPPPESPLVQFTMQHGRWLLPADSNALVVGSRLLDGEPSLQPGARVTLLVQGRRAEWTVVGVVPSLLTGAFAPRAAWKAAGGGGDATRMSIALRPRDPVVQAGAQRAIQRALADQGVEVRASGLLAENRAAVEDHLLMVAGFLGIMSWLMIVVGGLGLASTMSLSVLERTREIGVMRALGARHSAIHLIVQVEGLVIAVASWVVALPLSAPMSATLGAAFGRMFFKMPVRYVPDPAGAGIWLAVVVGVSMIACAWPAFSAMRVSAREALAYE